MTTCMVCSEYNPTWHTTDNLWAFAMDSRPDFQRVFCPMCFINACEENGLLATWRLIAQVKCAECQAPFDLIDPDDELCGSCIAAGA